MRVKDLIWDKHPERLEHIEEVAKRIRPIVRVDDVPYFVPFHDPVYEHFTRIKKRGPKALHLSVSREIKTYHTRLSWNSFLPTTAEVIMQIPEDLFDIVNAFEIAKNPDCQQDTLHEPEVVLQGYHTAIMRLYAGTKPVIWKDRLLEFLDKHLWRISEA